MQAEFGSLIEAKPPLGKFETEELVDTAVSTVLDGLDYAISYQQYTMFEPGQSADTYLATITIRGKSRQVLKEFSMPRESANDPAITLLGDVSPEERAMVEWAVERFAAAGLQLPDGGRQQARAERRI